MYSTEKAMMNLQQVLLNKLRHHSRQYGSSQLPLETEIDVRKSRSKIFTTDPFKILLQSPRSGKTAALQAIKACASKDSEKAKLQTSFSNESRIFDSSAKSDPTVPTNNDSERDAKENQTEINSLSLKSNDTCTTLQQTTVNQHRQLENDTKSTANKADKTTRQDSKQAVNSTGTSEDMKPPNQRGKSAEAENKLNEKSIAAGVLLESADKIGLQLERTKTLLSELDRQSEPADLQTDVDGPRETLREVHSARADLNLSPKRNPLSKEQIQAETRKMKEAVVLTIAKELCEERARNRLNKDLMSADDALYESPSYRDWETSDRSLKYLEERIARFYVETEKETAGRTPKPPLLPKLRRFEPTVSHAISFLLPRGTYNTC